MNRTILLSLFLLLLPAAAAVGAESADGGVRWYSYEEGLKRAAETGRPIVIDFHADWCKWCKVMDEKTFSDPRVVEAMNGRFVPVSVDTEADKKTAAAFQVRSLPTMWFLDAAGERIDSLPGFVEADFFTIVLDYIASGSYKTQDFQSFVDSRS